MRTGFKIAAVTGLAVLALTGCGRASQKSSKDVDPSGIVTGTHAKIIQEPSGFRNISFSCNGTVGMYVTSRGAVNSQAQGYVALPSGIAVLPNDPNCGVVAPTPSR